MTARRRLYWKQLDHVAQSRQLLVFRRQHGPIRRNGPVDAKVRIVPGDAEIMLRRIEICDLVNHLGVGFERHETMGEADGNEELPPVLPGELYRHMTAEGRRRASEVDRYVENAAAGRREFSLSWAKGGVWKCRPRIVPTSRESEWLSCTN